MKCEETLILISGHLDKMNTPEEEMALQAHLSGCPACREVLASFLEADNALGAMKETAPADLCANVMAQIGGAARQKRTRRWSSLAVAAALVAVVGITALKLPVADHAPQTVSQTQTDATARTLPSQDTHGLAQQVAQEQQGTVVVVRELYYEIESYPCTTLDEGYLLYTLPDRETAQALCDAYGCEIFMPEGETTAVYALLVP